MTGTLTRATFRRTYLNSVVVSKEDIWSFFENIDWSREPQSFMVLYSASRPALQRILGCFEEQIETRTIRKGSRHSHTNKRNSEYEQELNPAGGRFKRRTIFALMIYGVVIAMYRSEDALNGTSCGSSTESLKPRIVTGSWAHLDLKSTARLLQGWQCPLLRSLQILCVEHPHRKRGDQISSHLVLQ